MSDENQQDDDSLFNEFADALAGGAPEPQHEQDDEDARNQELANAAHAEFAAEAEAERQEQPASRPSVAAPVGAGGEADEIARAAQEVDALLANVPDAVRGQVREQLLRAKQLAASANGRYTAAERRRLQLEALTRQQPAKPAAPAEANPSGYSDAQWEAIKEDFPEIAAAVEARLTAERQQLNREVDERFRPIQAREEADVLMSQMAAVDAAVPGWQDTVKEAAFSDWLNQQPSAVRSLTGSNDASDTIWLLSQYNTARQAQTKAVDDVAARRQEQLAASTVRRSKATAATAGTSPDDADSLFNHFARQLQKRRA